MILILWLLFGHYVLDYPFQGEFLANTKGKYIYSLLAHSLIYSTGMSLVIYYNSGKLYFNHDINIVFLVLLVSHFVIDYLKSHAKNKDRALTSYLYIDQSLHLIINLILAMIYCR